VQRVLRPKPVLHGSAQQRCTPGILPVSPIMRARTCHMGPSELVGHGQSPCMAVQHTAYITFPLTTPPSTHWHLSSTCQRPIGPCAGVLLPREAREQAWHHRPAQAADCHTSSHPGAPSRRRLPRLNTLDLISLPTASQAHSGAGPRRAGRAAARAAPGLKPRCAGRAGAPPAAPDAHPGAWRG
jgi:hypothetical protein